MIHNIREKNTWLSFALAAFMLFSVLTFSILAVQAQGTDTTVPAWTYGVLDASNVTENSLTLTWSGASDDTAVTGYKIYQGTALLATVVDVTYGVSGLSAASEYTFTVQALDAVGNESTTGPGKTVTTAAAVGLNSPALTADSTDNTAGKAVDITFTDDATWRAAITGVTIDSSALTTGQYTVSTGKINIAAGVITTAGDHVITIMASLYPDATVTQAMVTPMTPPVLSADTTDTIVGNAIDIAFTDDAAWRGAITGIKVNSTTLTTSQYKVNAGDITIYATAFSTTSSAIVVSAAGYSDASVTQTVTAPNRYDIPYGYITTIAGNGISGYSGDSGFAARTNINSARGVAVDSAGNIYIADYNNYRIRKVDTNGIITTVAGTGSSGSTGDNGPATSAKIGNPYGVAVDSTGNLYIADYSNNRICEVAATSHSQYGINMTAGNIYTVAGCVTSSTYSKDGVAATSEGIKPYGVAVDNAGNIYIADYSNNRIRKVDTSGIITTVAGSSASTFSGDDGPATSAGIKPYGVAVDNAGNLYIADYGYNRIRKVDASGTITTVAGCATSSTYSKDGVAATSEGIKPNSVAVDSVGNIYIGDYANHRIRKVDASGTITTAAGINGYGYSGDGVAATSAALQPWGVTVDNAGNLYIGDSGNNRIRYVNVPLSTPGIKSLTLSGSPNLNYDGSPVTYDLGNGNLTLASLDQFGATFNLTGKTVTWKVSSGPATVAGSTLTITGSGAVTVTATVNGLASNVLAATAEQTPPAFTADNTGNFVDQAIDLTFTEDAYWRAAITGITVDGTALTTSQYTKSAGNIHFPVGVLATAGDHSIVLKAQGYADVSLTQTILDLGAPPVLTADSSNNVLGQAIDLTFTDAAWHPAITCISVNGTALTADQYTMSAGDISIAASAFTTAKSYTIVVDTIGYTDASVVQDLISAASFIGDHITTNLEIDASGLNMMVAPAAGYHFNAEKQITPEIKAALIDSMVFDYSYGMIDQNTGAVEKAASAKTNLTNINTIWTDYYAKTRVSEVGLSDTVIAWLRTYDATQDTNHKLFRTNTLGDGQEYLSCRGTFLAVGMAIQEELKARGTVAINADGNLVISCDNKGYLKRFTNMISLVNGGMAFVFGDLPVSLTVPADLVKEGVAVKTSNTFDFLEIKTHNEIWEYVDDSHAGEDGVVAVNAKYDAGSSRPASSFKYTPAYYIKRVPGDVLTEADVRNGGTLGPNGTGNKLIKVVVEGRTGPTWWAFIKWADKQLVYNAFRTNIAIDNYTLPEDSQTPQDDPQWRKIEDTILVGGAPSGSYYGFQELNKYLFNSSGDWRLDEYVKHDMWYTYEIPKIADFDITKDMTVYVNQLQGMTGGSGGGGANPQGSPFYGMDGRASFTIKAVATDLSAYNNALAAVTEADYTADSWAIYQAVVTANVMKAENTQAEVSAATTAITAAQANLVFAGKADLDAAKATAAEKVEANYTTTSWTVLTNALALPETTNAEVVAKSTAITAAQANLVFAGKADLDAAKVTAGAKVEAEYTTASWAVLANALALPEATNAEVVAKTTAINEAIAALVEKTDLTNYNAALTAVNQADYTADSWTIYQAVVTANVMTEGNTPAEVGAATTAITAGQANLVFAGKADLDAAKVTAGAKVEAEYTTASWAVLANALVMPETTNAEVVAKTTAINAAIAELQKPAISGGGGSSTPAGTQVSTQGGMVSDSGITLTVPAGAQASSVYVEIKKLTSASNLPVTEQQKLVSDVFELTKNITSDFSKAVTVKISFDKSKFDTDKYDLTLCWFDTGSNKWVALDNCQVDLSEGTVSGEVAHFTKFAVIAVKKAGVDVPAATLSDISTHWAKDYINTLVQSGAISGYPDASFKPDNTITRAEFATVLVKAYHLPVAAGKTFNDTASHWACDYIATAYAAGIINGYSDSSFGPDDPVTREQMAVMIAKAAKINTAGTESTFTDSSQVSVWAKDALNAVTQAGIMKGYPDGSFNPQGEATRAEMAAVIVNALK